MAERIPLSSPDITQSEIDAVTEVLRGRFLSFGPKLPAFEAALAEAAGARHAVAVSSGTAGLHLSVRALGLGPGDEVVTTPFSFVASANALLYEGVRPVFVDVDPADLNLDVARVEATITPRTRGVLPVHVFGRPTAMEPLSTLCRERGLVLLEDACEALGAEVGGRPVGALGDAGVFAFYPNKQITTGEGGAVVTNDRALAERIGSLRNHGRAPGSEVHTEVGYNCRLSELACALGLAQLRRLPEILERRAQVARWYHERLRDREDFVLPDPELPGGRISWFVYVVRLASRFFGKDRDAIWAELRRQGIGCGRYFAPIHLQPPYRDRFGHGPGDFPIAEAAGERTLALPFHARLTVDEVDEVCGRLARALASL